MDNFESFGAKKARDPDNREWWAKQHDGGDDVAKMGEMLRTGECLGIETIKALHLKDKREVFHWCHGIFVSG
ncbi:hypothetical protein H1R20_g16033, partial [Candolleomyces eurysporus]